MMFSRKLALDAESPLEQVHNYYERRVIETLHARRLPVDEDTFADLVCIALNELPAKYIRHEVDMVYFSESAEIAAMHSNIERAVDGAIRRMASNHWEKRD